MVCPVSTYKVTFFGKFKNSIYYFKRDLNNYFFFQGTLWSSDLHGTRKRAKKSNHGKGGKFDFFHILMLDRLGYN